MIIFDHRYFSQSDFTSRVLREIRLDMYLAHVSGEASIQPFEDKFEYVQPIGKRLDSMLLPPDEVKQISKKHSKKLKKKQDKPLKTKKKKRHDSFQLDSQSSPEGNARKKKKHKKHAKEKESKKPQTASRRASSVSTDARTVATEASTKLERRASSREAELRREAFYKEMKELAPDTFNYLLEFYLSQGQAEEHARYFAAYYTALKINNEGASSSTI